MAHNYKDLQVLVLDVGPHMQPYLPLLHRLVFNALNTKLLFKPLHEVAVVLYGTEGTRHELHDPDDPAATYPHVTVLRPLQAVGDYMELQYFVYASDAPPPPADEAWHVGGSAGAGEEGDGDAAAAGPARLGLPHLTDAEADAAAAALQRHVEAAGVGVAGRSADGAATAAGRAVRLFGRPGPRSDWADGLVVALDLLARARRERFAADKRVKGLRLTLVSNFVGQSEPLDDEMAGCLVSTLEELGCGLEVAALDHYVPPPAAAATAAATAATAGAAAGDTAAEGAAATQATAGDGAAAGAAAAAAGVVGATASDREALAALPAGLAVARCANLEALHGLKARLKAAPFTHLRQPGELLCLTNAAEVSMTASLADLRLTPAAVLAAAGGAGGPDAMQEGEGGTQGGVLPDISLKVKLYKKVQQVKLTGWTSYYSGGGGAGAGAGGGGGDGEAAAPAGAAEGADAEGAEPGGAGGPGRHGLLREVEYEDPTTGEKFDRDSLVRGYNFGAQVVPLDEVTAATSALHWDKGLSLLGFLPHPHSLVPHHRLVGEPSVVVGADATATAALAALARAMDAPTTEGGPRPGTGAIARFKNRAAVPALVLLTPHLSNNADVPDCLLLSPLPYFEDLRAFFFPTFRNEQEAKETAEALAAARAARTGVAAPPAAFVPGGGSGAGGSSSAGGGLMSGPGSSQAGGTQAGNGGSSQQGDALGVRWEKLQPTQAQQEAASELVKLLDLGSQPLLLPTQQPSGGGGEQRPEALQPQHTVNPHLQRAYGFVTSRALNSRAELPHPDDDPLVDALLRPTGACWRPGAAAALAAAEPLLNTTERVYEGRGGARRSLDGGDGAAEGDAAAAEAEPGEGGGAAAGGAAGTGAHQDLLGEAAAAATAGGAAVTSVRRATAEEDFRAMLAAGKEPAARAVSQLGHLVAELVESSPGDMLYGRALQARLLAALRAGAAAAGRAGAFNARLRQLVADCTAPGRGKTGFVSRLLADRLTLLSTADLPPAAGGSGPPALPHSEDDGGAVTPAAAAAFLEELAVAAAAAAGAGAAGGAVGGAGADLEATLAPAEVVVDEAFEDMD
ncbi:hypothetical protein HXX76_000853 [Chlamydomonas incerta]|uniref:Ku domain-containing protein n=1 Tax=Chlamydomonas incerta TaxID=51695 RepID=A0A835WF32_CHLIN|nr:hypothetical protein HXX76_000853 [Chlamydomonas incerta]|eukprot:KAG2446263.1 hypothetical protein HXX76_000853 [Chlamydomonas incerta]